MHPSPFPGIKIKTKEFEEEEEEFKEEEEGEMIGGACQPVKDVKMGRHVAFHFLTRHGLWRIPGRGWIMKSEAASLPSFSLSQSLSQAFELLQKPLAI